MAHPSHYPSSSGGSKNSSDNPTPGLGPKDQIMDLQTATTPRDSAMADVIALPVATRPVPAFLADVCIPASLLRAVTGWASSDETRPQLCGVHFQGADMVATDGHRLIKVACLPDGSASRPTRCYTVPAGALIAACRAAGKGWIEIDPVARTIRATTKATRGKASMVTTVAYVPVEIQFPPYNQVIPDFDGAPMTPPDKGTVSGHGINPRYLGAMADVCEASGRSAGVLLRKCGGPLDPVLYTMRIETDAPSRNETAHEIESRAHLKAGYAFMVIMPMRI